MSSEDCMNTALDGLQSYLRARDAFQTALQKGLMEIEYLRCEIGHDRLHSRDCMVYEKPLYTIATKEQSRADTEVPPLSHSIQVQPANTEGEESQLKALDQILQDIDPTHAEQLRRIQSCFRQALQLSSKVVEKQQALEKQQPSQ